MKVRILKPSKSAMQSGLENTKLWIIEPIEEERTRSIDSLTGWTSSNNMTVSQLKLKFKNKEEAIKYAESQNWQYIVYEPETATIKRKSYADNFTN